MGENYSEQVPFLQMKDIVKSFHGVHALKGVDLTVRKGQVTSLVGENGAGKSTLMKVLGGIHQKDSGQILINGKETVITGPSDAINQGISIIHQELNDIPTMSITENIFAGKELRKKNGKFVDLAAERKKAAELLKMVDLNIDPDTLVMYLSTAQKQLIEILRAVAANTSVLVMDEPTSSLTSRETDKLFEIIEMLKKQDVGIVFISHRMEEIMKLSDKVVVLRDGHFIGELTRAEMTEEKIITMMVGRELTELYPESNARIGDVVLEAKNICSGFVRDVSFSVRKGEILGFAGLVGAGRTEVMRAIFGIDKLESGQILLDGKEVHIANPREAIALGIGLVPEDRKLQALVLGMTVRENMTLAALRSLKKGVFYDASKEVKLTEEMDSRLNVVTPSIEQQIKNLSGGNQQKVVLGKWLLTNPRVLILDEPTRGIDVGAKKEIHELMCELAGQGVSIIMISSELPEVIGMSDRIVIMHEGRKKGEVSGKNVTQEELMRIAVGKGEGSENG